MLTLFLISLHAFGDLEKTTAANLFSEETRLSAPNKYNGNSGLPLFDVKSETDATVGKIYSELRYILSHYFSYFVNNNSEFKFWYNSDDYEMDDDLKKRIMNSLGSNVTSINDLDSFWLYTQGPYLEARLTRLTSRINRLKALMNMQDIKYNRIKDDLQLNTLTAEDRNIWLINKAIFIVENLRAGLKNHEDGRYPNIYKNFLTAVVEKKKIDEIFTKLVLSI